MWFHPVLFAIQLFVVFRKYLHQKRLQNVWKLLPKFTWPLYNLGTAFRSLSLWSICSGLRQVELHLTRAELAPENSNWYKKQIAESLLEIYTCSTLHTTGVMFSLFNFVYTVCRPPTRCFRNKSKACWRTQLWLDMMIPLLQHMIWKIAMYTLNAPLQIISM